MPKYTVADGHKKLNGKKYAPGDTIECTEEVAARLRLVPVEDKPPVEDAGSGGQGSGSSETKKRPAAELIAAIGECTTVDQVKAFFAGEERPTVKDAAKAKIKELNAAAKAASKE
jgi:hypothetical protein